MKEITKAQVDGDKNKSLKISYEPQIKIKEGIYNSLPNVKLKLIEGNYVGGS